MARHNGGIDKTDPLGTMSSEWYSLGRPYQLVGNSGMATSHSYNAPASVASSSGGVEYAAISPTAPTSNTNSANSGFDNEDDHEGACEEVAGETNLALSAPMKRARWGATHAIHEYFSDGFPELAERFVRTRASAAQRRFEYNLGSCRFCDVASAVKGLKKLKTLFRQLDSACGVSDQPLVQLRRSEFVAELRKWGWRRGARLQYRQAKSTEQLAEKTLPASHISDNQVCAERSDAQLSNNAAGPYEATKDEGGQNATVEAEPYLAKTLRSSKQSTNLSKQQHSACDDTVGSGCFDKQVAAEGVNTPGAGAAQSLLEGNVATRDGSDGTNSVSGPHVLKRIGDRNSTTLHGPPSEATPHQSAEGKASKSNVDESTLQSVSAVDGIIGLPPTESWWTQHLNVISRRPMAREVAESQPVAVQQQQLQSCTEVGDQHQPKVGQQPIPQGQSFDGIGRMVSSDALLEQDGGSDVSVPSEWKFPSISQLPNNPRSPVVTSPNCKHTAAAWYSHAQGRQAVAPIASQRGNAHSVLEHRQVDMVPAYVAWENTSHLLTSGQSCQLEETIHGQSSSSSLPLRSSQLHDQDPSSVPRLSLSFRDIDDVSDANSEDHSLCGIEDFKSLDESPRVGTNKQGERHDRKSGELAGRSSSAKKKTKRAVPDDAALLELDSGEHVDSGGTMFPPRKRYCGTLPFDEDQREGAIE